MRKMKCLFKRDYSTLAREVTREVNDGCEWVMKGEGTAYRKWDGTACMVKDSKLYKRYDAKAGKNPPDGAIPCDPSPDPITGHWPHWIVVGDEPASKWHREAMISGLIGVPDGTYELCGPRINGNPDGIDRHMLIGHKSLPVEIHRDFDWMKGFLYEAPWEGIVFHHPDGNMVKIRRSDFGFPWPLEKKL